MKKYTVTAWITLLLCLLSAGVILYAHGQLTLRGEDVSVTETVLFGDKKEAEGVTVQTKSALPGPSTDKSLNWNTTYDIQKDQLLSETAFNLGKMNAAGVLYPSVHLEISVYDSTYFDPERIQSAASAVLPEEVLENAVHNTKKGQTHTETFNLRDYLTSYPVMLNFTNMEINDSFTHWSAAGPEQEPVDYSYFRLPIMEDLPRKIQVKKDTSGDITEITTESIAPLLIDFNTVSAFARDENCIYTAISGLSIGERRQEIPDTTLGIHRIPLKKYKDYPDTPDEYAYPDMANARKVYDLKAGQHLVKMEVDPSGENLLLFTQEDKESSTVTLSVIGIDDMKLKQQLEVFSDVSPDLNEEYLELRFKEDYLLIIAYSYAFTLLHDDSHKYEIKEQCTLRGRLPKDTYVHGIADAYDGNRLVLAVQPAVYDSFDSTEKTSCSSYLFVCKNSRLTYGGFYENSLSQVLYYNDEVTVNPLAIVFEEASK